MIRSIDINVTQELLMENAHFFKLLPENETSKETIFARCLLGTYATWFFKEDDKVVGIACFSVDRTTAFITGIVLPKKTKYFYTKFYRKLTSLGLTYLKAVSSLEQQRFEGFSGFKKLYSVYGKEL